jgi:hypothetical protein
MFLSVPQAANAGGAAAAWCCPRVHQRLLPGDWHHSQRQRDPLPQAGAPRAAAPRRKQPTNTGSAAAAQGVLLFSVSTVQMHSTCHLCTLAVLQPLKVALLPLFMPLQCVMVTGVMVSGVELNTIAKLIDAHMCCCR